jgi:hypothetical protein
MFEPFKKRYEGNLKALDPETTHESWDNIPPPGRVEECGADHGPSWAWASVSRPVKYSSFPGLAEIPSVRGEWGC